MNIDEEKYKKDLEAAGVDLPEIIDEKKDNNSDQKDDVKSNDQKSDDDNYDLKDKKTEKSDDNKDDDDDSDDEPKIEDKKRSIYKDFKDEKKQRKNLENEVKDLKSKLEKYENADTKEEKDEALDELDEYSKKYNADPDALKELKSIILKSIGSTDNSVLAEKLEKFEQWQKDNAKVISDNEFNKEFESATPFIKDTFPKISDVELSSVKKELNKLAHSTEWADKDLDYIIFKNKKTLEALVSPKKKGLENNDTKEESDEIKFDFDPNADISKMSPANREKWYAEYNKAGKSEGLMKDSEGRMSIL